MTSLLVSYMCIHTIVTYIPYSHHELFCYFREGDAIHARSHITCGNPQREDSQHPTPSITRSTAEWHAQEIVCPNILEGRQKV